MKIIIYKSFNNNKLKYSWRNIVDRYGYFIQNSYDWCRIWWQHFRNNKRELYIITVQKEDEIYGIAPMYLEHHILHSCMRFLGAPLTDFHDLLIIKNTYYNTVVYLFLDFFQKLYKWDIVFLEQINSEGELFQIFNGLLPKKIIIECPIIELEGFDWESYFSQINSRNLRNDFKKKFRRLQKDCTLQFQSITQDEEFLNIFHEIVKLHVARWASESEDSKFKSKTISKFIKEVFCTLMKNKLAVLWLLYYNKQVIAYRLGFTHEKTFYDWNTSHNLLFNKYSPGKIITGCVIRHLIEHNFHRFHFMRGGYKYKKAWMPRGRENISINYLFLITKTGADGWLLKNYYLKWRDYGKKIFGSFLRKTVVRKVFGIS